MSRLGIPDFLLGGRFGDGLAQAAAQAQQAAAQQAAMTPDLLFQGLARAADAQQKTTELVSRMRADQAAGLREALAGAVAEYNRSRNAAENRSAAAREGGLERASRERIAEADRTTRSEDRAAERLTQIDVANIGADARRYAADERDGGGFSLGKTLDALGQEKIKARLENTPEANARAARAEAMETAGYAQAFDAAATDDEKQMVLKRARQAGVKIGPDAVNVPPPAAPPKPRTGVFGPDGSFNFGLIGDVVSPNRTQTFAPTAAAGRTWADYAADLTYPLRNFFAWPFGGLERSAQPIGPRPIPVSPESVAPQPFGMQDFLRSMDGLPQPATSPPLMPATQPAANPLYLNGIDWADLNRNRR